MKESKKQMVTYEHLWIRGYDFLHIEKFELIQKINEHAKLYFTGIIEQEKEEELVFYTQAGQQIEVYYKINAEDEARCMFCGTVINVSVTEEKQIKHLEVEAYSNSYLLDEQLISRSFQNTSETYQQVINNVLSDEANAEAVYLESAAKPTKEFIIQYRETDWEFIKRLASRFHVPLLPVLDAKVPKFYYGIAEQKQAEEIQVLSYRMKKDIQNYQVERSNYLQGMKEADYITFEVDSWDIRRAGEAVIFKKVIFYIKKAVYRMEQGVLTGTYSLGSKNSLQQRTIYNKQLKGISLNGTIAGVLRDKVQVQLSLDGKRKNALYYFPYSTISASPDGSGWYCMPEIGDEIRVYFPDTEEKNCFAISSVSSYTPKEGDSSDRMSDPNVKYLRTAANKEIMLAPNAIVINADDGQAKISLDQDGNVYIVGQKNIEISAVEDVTITAGTSLSLYAQNSITFESSNAKYTMEESGDTRMEGNYVLEN